MLSGVDGDIYIYPFGPSVAFFHIMNLLQERNTIPASKGFTVHLGGALTPRSQQWLWTDRWPLCYRLEQGRGRPEGCRAAQHGAFLNRKPLSLGAFKVE